MFGKLKAFFAAVWNKLKPEEEAAIEAFEAKITPDVLNLAKDGIAYAATLGVGGTAARDAAVEKIIVDGKATGVDVVSFARSELNALVELVYVAVKPTTPAAEPAPAEPVAEKTAAE